MQKHPPQQSQALLVPATEGIKYAGSKLKLLPHIIPLVCGLPDIHSVLDGFAGSTRVSQALYQTGHFALTSNDLSVWSEVFARSYLQAPTTPTLYTHLIDHLNAMPGEEGWFAETYGRDDITTKHPFQRKNLMRLDAIRNQIARWRNEGTIDHITESVLLTSLILALDVVDSTLGHFSSYLKNWSKRSYNDLHLRLPRLCHHPDFPAARVERSDIFQLLSNTHLTPTPTYDLAYYDPPYGSNNTKMPPSRVRYAAYYHFWTSVILNDQPAVFGKAARREDSRDPLAASPFEDYRATPDGRPIAMDAIDRLISHTPARYILLSYSSSGRTSRNQLLDILHSHGHLRQTLSIDHAHHAMSRMHWTSQWLNADDEHKEYLFLLEKA